MVQGRGAHVESGGLLELKRQNGKSRDTKASRGCRIDYWRGETCREREREREHQIPSEFF